MSTNHPDADLYPHATGLAADLVKRHQEEQPLKLYAGWFCPFVQRVLLSLEEKNIPYQYIEARWRQYYPVSQSAKYKQVNPYHKQKSLLDLNPRGLVPTLQYDNKPLYESTVVAEFIEDAYPEYSPKLMPSSPYEKARMKIWMDFVTSRLITSFHRFLQFQPEVSKPGGIERVRSEFVGNLKQFAQEMDEEGPYFMGKDISLIDLNIAPWAVRLWVFDHFKGGLNLPTEGPDAQVWKRFQRWLDAIQARPSIKNTTSDQEHYLPIYARYANNTAQSELAKATREGTGVP